MEWYVWAWVFAGVSWLFAGIVWYRNRPSDRIPDDLQDAFYGTKDDWE